MVQIQAIVALCCSLILIREQHVVPTSAIDISSSTLREKPRRRLVGKTLDEYILFSPRGSGNSPRGRSVPSEQGIQTSSLPSSSHRSMQKKKKKKKKKKTGMSKSKSRSIAGMGKGKTSKSSKENKGRDIPVVLGTMTAPPSGCTGSSCIIPSPPPPPPSASPSPPSPAPAVATPSQGILPPTVSSTEKTAAPTYIGERIPLSSFKLGYEYEEAKIPLVGEIAEVSSLTGEYIKSALKKTATGAIDVVTRMTGDRFLLFQPYEIDYKTTIFFNLGFEPLPDTAELDKLLVEVFAGDNVDSYLEYITERLSVGNPFKSTMKVQAPFQEPSSEPRIPNTTSRSSLGASTGIGAGMFIAMIAGLVVYKRRRVKGSEPESDEKDAHHLTSHLTLAGDETYGGASTLFSGSDSDGVTEHHGEATSDNGYSEWGTLTHTMTEDGSEDLERLGLEEPRALPLPRTIHEIAEETENDDTTVASSTKSEDSNVPIRVVDLIKLFSQKLTASA